MTKAQVIHELGPPKVMCWEDWEVAPPGEGEVRLRHTAIGSTSPTPITAAAYRTR